jgi:hypothetical protein
MCGLDVKQYIPRAPLETGKYCLKYPEKVWHKYATHGTRNITC